jgi:CRP/FNR family transcriptional regulator
MITGEPKIGLRRMALAELNERTFKRGTLIFVEGEPGEEMFIVRSGKVRMLKDEGGTVELAVVGPGSVLGELSLLDNQTRPATAQVIEDTVAAVIGRELFTRTLRSAPSWFSSVVNSLVKDLREALQRSSREVVKKHTAAAARILVLLYDSETGGGRDAPGIPLEKVREAMYSLVGLGRQETEMVFLDLILRNMLCIRGDGQGNEFAHIKDHRALRVYVAFLRARQCASPLPGAGLSPAAVRLLDVILTVADKAGKEMHDAMVAVGLPQLALEVKRQGRDGGDSEALEELVAAKIVLRRHGADNRRGLGKHAAVVFSRDTLEQIRTLRRWLPVFEEEITF